VYVQRHYEVIFSRHCTFFSVVSEMQFAAQGEARDTPDKDAVLLTVDRGKVFIGQTSHMHTDLFVLSNLTPYSLSLSHMYLTN
jgi:hypothetical protein